MPCAASAARPIKATAEAAQKKEAMKGSLFFAGLTFPQSSLNFSSGRTEFKRQDGQNE
jgi:hypothetical protein